MKILFKLAVLCFVFLIQQMTIAQEPLDANATFICPHCDLTGMDFSGKDLTNANLSGATLVGANFTGAILNGAQLIGANLQNANFNEAILSASQKAWVNFTSADLTNATFVNAKIGKANFQFTNISCADFSNTNLIDATFGTRFVHAAVDGCPPKFANCIMSCEFPEKWSSLDLNGTTLPKCNNVLLINKKGKKMCKKWKHHVLPKTKRYSHTLFKLDPKYAAPASPIKAPKDSIWVTTNGKDNFDCGSKTKPCASLERALKQCQTAVAQVGNCGVMMEAAQFQLKYPVRISTDSISVIGGFHNFKPTIYQTEITGSPDGGHMIIVDAKGVNFSSLIIRTTPEQLAGFYYTNCLFLQKGSSASLHESSLAPFKGYNGRSGKNGIKGLDGENGQDAPSAKKGGQGGAARCNFYAGGSGWPPMVTDRPPPSNAVGEDGKIYNGPIPQVPVSVGFFASDFNWLPASPPNYQYNGFNGVQGYGQTPGGGGSNRSMSPAGGGGGSSGCPGTTPDGGANASASFGMIANEATLHILGDKVIIVGGKGGTGGKGGDGAPGGKGGLGGKDSNGSATSPTAGKPGGRGPASSGAGGGNGGLSLCVAIIKEWKLIGNPIFYQGMGGDPGAKGIGGAKGDGVGPGIDGPPGLRGISAIQISF